MNYHSEETPRRMRNHQERVNKHHETSENLSLESFTTLLVMACHVDIAAAALALASKPSLQVDNVFFSRSSDKAGDYPTAQHTRKTKLPLLYILFGLAGTMGQGDFLMLP